MRKEIERLISERRFGSAAVVLSKAIDVLSSKDFKELEKRIKHTDGSDSRAKRGENFPACSRKMSSRATRNR